MTYSKNGINPNQYYKILNKRVKKNIRLGES